jgi:hypothetical protein
MQHNLKKNVAISSSNDEHVTGALAWLNLMNTQNQAWRRFWVHAYWRAIPTNLESAKYLKI